MHCEYVPCAYATPRMRLIRVLSLVCFPVPCLRSCFCVLNAHGAALVEEGKKANQAQVDAEAKRVRSQFADIIWSVY